MRQVYIDLTTEHARASNGNFVGYMGEHNATELLITIPQIMVDQSDYQVLVFQSGPMVFRTKNITEDKSQPTYRDGNTIHTKLTKSLTKVTALALQVECYKENEDGAPTLIGKTQTVSHLVLKPSPDGFPAFGYEGAFEDIEMAIHDAHKHNNLETLAAFSVNDDGDVLFNGELIKGVKKYQQPSSLPETAPIGTLALAENDDEDTSEPETISINTQYPFLKLKDNIELADFSDIRYIDSGSSDDEVLFYLNDKNDDTIAQVIMLHRPSENMSFMAILNTDNIKAVRPLYPCDALFIDDRQAYYFFNPYKEFDFAALNSDAVDSPIYVGEGFYIGRQVQPTINQYLSISSRLNVYKIDDDNLIKNVHMPYEDITIVPSDSDYDTTYSEKMLSALFETVKEKPKAKGLYLFTDEGWQNIESLCKAKNVVVNTLPELPLDADEGTLAYVINNAYIWQNNRYFTLYKSSTYQALYLAPWYNEFALLYDFNVKLEFWRRWESGTEAKYMDAIMISTNKEQQYFVLDAKPTNTPNERHLIYSFKDQSIQLNGNSGTTIDVTEGWNEIFTNYTPVRVKNHLSFDELPHFIISESSQTLPAYFKVIVMYADAYGGDRTSMPMYHFWNEPYGEIDNAKGLWVKTKGEWHKVISNEQFIIEEE